MRLFPPVLCSIDERAGLEVGSPHNHIAVDGVNENLWGIKLACNSASPESWTNVC